MLCITAGLVQMDSYIGMARLVLLVTVHLVLCFLPCLQARDARHHGRCGPGGLVCWFLTLSLAVCSLLCLLAPDARHHGRHGPQDSVEVHRCSSWTRFSTCPLLCHKWYLGPDSAVHCLAFPQLQFITVVDFLLRYRGLLPWSCCSADHRVSPVAQVHVVDVPVMQAVQLPRWFAVLGHADDMPVVVNNRCLELDSVELQRFRAVHHGRRHSLSIRRVDPHGPGCSDDH